MMDLLARVQSVREYIMGSMKRKDLVAVAKTGRKTEIPASSEVVRIVDKPSSSKREVTALQMACIQMLARGYLLHEVSKRYQLQLVPHESRPAVRRKKARIRLRRWMSTQKFRDLLWEETMVGLDLDSPQIVRGVARKAKAGRVDAARLALELNGRYAPHTEVTPAQINIQFGAVPRPRRSSDDADVVDADPDDIVEIEDD
jgi:hypothetical protein